MSPLESAHTFPATLESLPLLQEFIRVAAEKAGVAGEVLPVIDMVAEELFVNIVEYGQLKKSEPVEARCYETGNSSQEGKLFCFSLRDCGAPFNPMEREVTDLDADIETREQGGLGIYLVTQMSEFCSYSREDECNIFKVCFRYS